MQRNLVFIFTLQVNSLPLAYPSLLGHKLSHQLLHPLFAFLASADTPASERLLPTFAGLQTPFPCDIFLVTMRSIQGGKEPRPSDEALMVLHRNGYDCNFVSSCSKQTSGGKVSCLVDGKSLRYIQK